MSANDSDRLAQQDALFRAKVTRARQRSPGDKLLDGERLFHENAIWMKAGIRAQHPDFTPEQEEAEYRRRLAIARKLDNELFERVGTLCI